MKILNVAEKNDAAKSLADLMSRGSYRRRDGFSQYNKIYEFDFNFRGQQCSMVMTSVSGHLLDLDFVGQYRMWKSCSPSALFDAPVELFCPQDYENIKKTLEREVKSCQKLIIWTDCDREGENIGFEIIQVCRAAKPSIEVLRARFSEITHQAVAAAVRNAAEPDENVSLAVEVRRELDLRIGAAFTRFLTMRYQQVFPDVLSAQVVSYGSCQFPTLGFVVERYKQIQRFVAEQYWSIRVVIKHSSGAMVEFLWKRGRLFDRLICSVLHGMCVERPLAKVIDVKSKSTSKWRPVALDTVEFEKMASKKLRITAKEAMLIAEKLYTKGFISYPRTETNQFPPDIDLAALIEKQTADQRWGEFASGLLESGGPTPRNGKKSDQAHPPIHPLKHTASLQGAEQSVYEFVVRHFLACCSKDAKGFETNVEIDVAGERFHASGLVITERNYLDVYPYEKWTEKELPEFKVGETHEPQSVEMSEGQTSPPSLLTEADLIALMEKHGIGTDATHAEHIERVKQRSYVGVQADGRFVPGELGMGLVEGYDALGFEFSKPHLRAELEADLKLICEGRKNKDDVLQEQLRKYKELFMVSLQQVQTMDTEMSKYLGEAKQIVAELFPAAAEPVMPCPVCGLPMTLKQRTQGGFYIGCTGYPRCQSAMWLPPAIREASVHDATCGNCSQGREVHLLKLCYKRGSVPPTLPPEHEACVLCDPDLKDVFNLSIKMSQSAGTAASSHASIGGPTVRQPIGGGRLPATTEGVVRRPVAPAGQPLRLPTLTSGLSRPPLSQQAADGFLRTPTAARLPAPAAQSQPARGSGFRGTGSRSGSDVSRAAATVTFGSRDDAGDEEVLLEGDANVIRFAQIRNATPRQPRRPDLDTAANGSSWESTPRSRGGASGADALPQSVVCGCGTDAVCLTVRKQGPNCGRQFYKCAKPLGEQTCNFFLWADEPPPPQQPGRPSFDASERSPFSSQPIPSSQLGFSAASRAGAGNRRTGATAGSGYGFGGDGFSLPDRASAAVDGGGENVVCRCGLPAKQLTVHKEGPNKGRPFFGCSQPREQQCGFFQWADEPPAVAGAGGGYGGRGSSAIGRGASTGRWTAGRGGGAAGSAGRSKRKCGFCGREGHNRTKCPDVPGNS